MIDRDRRQCRRDERSGRDVVDPDDREPIRYLHTDLARARD